MGQLPSELDELLADTTPQEFKEVMLDMVSHEYDAAWVVGGDAVVFTKEAGPRMQVAGIVVLPTVSLRRRLECAVAFAAALSEIPLTIEAEMPSIKWLEFLCKKHVLRRVGTFFNPEWAAVFEAKNSKGVH